MSDTPYLRRRAAAEYLRSRWGIPCSEKTMAKLACVGGGPVYRLCGKIPLYTPADLDAFASPKSASRSARRRNTRPPDPPSMRRIDDVPQHKQ